MTLRKSNPRKSKLLKLKPKVKEPTEGGGAPAPKK